MWYKLSPERYRRVDRQLQQIEQFFNSLAQEIQETTEPNMGTGSSPIWTQTLRVNKEIEVLRSTLAADVQVQEPL